MPSLRRRLGCALAAAACAVAAAPASAASGARVAVVVAVNDTAPIQTLDDMYLGYNIDSGSLYRNIQLNNAVLQQLVRNLAPAQLRIGGSASDSVWYVPDGTAGPGPTPDPLAPNYASTLSQPWFNASAPGAYEPEVTIVSDASWQAITGFAAATGTSLLWDVNAVDFRTPNGAWDPAANASALFAYTASAGLPVAAWELGNEPDIYNHHFNMTISGAQLAADLRTMQAALAAANLSTAVFGPSLATWNATLVQDYLTAWAQSGGGQLGFTAHAYPLGPPIYPAGSPASLQPQSTTGHPSCSETNFFNRTRVNDLANYLGNFSAAVAAYGDPASTRMVLEETASNSLGGCVGYSDRFISGFYWVNVLGVVGEAGWHQVNRQDLFTAAGSQYTLFGPPGWTNGSGLVAPRGGSPHPDYFTSLLWRRLMGSVVLGSSLRGDEQELFSAHVWCSGAGAPGVGAGSVTLAYTNGYASPVEVALTDAAGVPYEVVPRSEFFLTGDALTGPAVYLNAPRGGGRLLREGARLKVNADGSLPAELAAPAGRLVAKATKGGLLVPAHSYGFVVLPKAGVWQCPDPRTQPGAGAATPAAGAPAAFTAADARVAAMVAAVAVGVALAARVASGRGGGRGDEAVELARGKAGAGAGYGSLWAAKES